MKKNSKIKVVVVMGSQSDLSVMKPASELLSRWKVQVLTQIVSAHRTPELLEKSVHEWEESGVKVIIAGAGGAAHLPGMLASFSLLPVIGVPIKSKAMNGLDSLLSIAQMPKGVPVATFAIGKPGAANAAIFAAEMLAATDEPLRLRLQAWREARTREVLAEVIGEERSHESPRDEPPGGAPLP